MYHRLNDDRQVVGGIQSPEVSENAGLFKQTAAKRTGFPHFEVVIPLPIH
jgi:hypothetical protein